MKQLLERMESNTWIRTLEEYLHLIKRWRNIL